jgi:HSCB C-terminal oligomerisation domain
MGTVTDSAMLMEIMELRESVEEGSPEELKAIGVANREKIEVLVGELGSIFAAKGILSSVLCIVV